MVTDRASDTTIWCMNASGNDLYEQVVNSPQWPAATIGATAVNTLGYGLGGEAGPGATNEVFGQAGRDVTGLSFTTLAGQTITATVQDGFWSLWWPLRRSYDTVGGTVTWTTADGASHTAALFSIMAPDQKPGATARAGRRGE